MPNSYSWTSSLSTMQYDLYNHTGETATVITLSDRGRERGLEKGFRDGGYNDGNPQRNSQRPYLGKLKLLQRRQMPRGLERIRSSSLGSTIIPSLSQT